MNSSELVTVRHARRTPGRPGLRYTALAVASVLVFGAVVAQSFKTHVEDAFTAKDVDGLLGPDRPAAQGNPNDPSAGQPVNILLMGSDSRSGVNAILGGEEDGKRSDTTLIMHISSDRSRVELVSIPRDTMVQLAECQRSDGSTQKPYFGMFNEAFANGVSKTGLDSDGAACTIRTVESLTGIRLDHYAVIDFEGFVNMVDAVKGVPMCIPKQYADPDSGTFLNPGPQVLNGNQAVAYVRMRHGKNTNGSDLDRIDRQQQFLKNLASKVISADMLYRPQEITNFIQAVASSMTVDESLGDLDFLAGLAFSLRSLSPSAGIVMATAPVEAYPADTNRVQFSKRAKDMWAAILNDQPIAPLLDAQSASPANSPEVTQAPVPPVEPTTQPTTAPSTPATQGPVAPSSPAPAVDPNSEQGILDACQVG